MDSATYKSIFSSKTFWSVIINIGLKIAGLFFVVDVDDETVSMVADSAVGLSLFLASFAADAAAIYGRVKAKRPIAATRSNRR